VRLKVLILETKGKNQRDINEIITWDRYEILVDLAKKATLAARRCGLCSQPSMRERVIFTGVWIGLGLYGCGIGLGLYGCGIGLGLYECGIGLGSIAQPVYVLSLVYANE
jgi:hypothetical protein